jgi:hypothetical protein
VGLHTTRLLSSGLAGLPPRVTLVSPAVSHETIAPFAPLRGAGVERTGLNVFAVSGCVLAVFVGGDHWVIPTFDEANFFHSTALAVIGSTMFRF